MVFPQIFAGPVLVLLVRPTERMPRDLEKHASPTKLSSERYVAVIGGGPAGLMAADVLSAAGCAVTVYDRMPIVGEKIFARGTRRSQSHAFRRHGRSSWRAMTRRPQHLSRTSTPSRLARWRPGAKIWASRRSSAPAAASFQVRSNPLLLLRAWLRRLDERGVRFQARHTWTGWDEAGALTFETAEQVRAPRDATSDRSGDGRRQLAAPGLGRPMALDSRVMLGSKPPTCIRPTAVARSSGPRSFANGSKVLRSSGLP